MTPTTLACIGAAAETALPPTHPLRRRKKAWRPISPVKEDIACHRDVVESCFRMASGYEERRGLQQTQIALWRNISLSVHPLFRLVGRELESSWSARARSELGDQLPSHAPVNSHRLAGPHCHWGMLSSLMPQYQSITEVGNLSPPMNIQIIIIPASTPLSYTSHWTLPLMLPDKIDWGSVTVTQAGN
uniref:Uncharacterized protein n=1 Tax=Aegilops tauschii TaxID=37682 RepID=M8AU58_AEGTA